LWSGWGFAVGPLDGIVVMVSIGGKFKATEGRFEGYVGKDIEGA